MDELKYLAPEYLALGCSPQSTQMPYLKVYRVVSAVSGLKKSNMLAFSEQEAIRNFSNMFGVEPSHVVVLYSYPWWYREML